MLSTNYSVTSNGSRPVAFLDSGIGGIPYLEGARKLLPGHRLCYHADRLNFPYGEKTPEQVRSVVRLAVQRLIERVDPCLIVVACNTASVVALDSLRSEFSVPFVGVVPAVKPAASGGGRGAIGIMATQRTVSDPYVSRLIAQFAPDHEVTFIAAGGLIDAIEQGEVPADLERTRRLLADPIRQLINSGVESLVLGCTHFIHVREQIVELVGPAIRVVDSVDGVVRQIRRRVLEAGCTAAGADLPPQFSCSGALPDSYVRLAASYGYALDSGVSIQ